MKIGIDCRSLQEPQPSGVSVYTREMLHALLGNAAATNQSFVLFCNAWSLRGHDAQEALKDSILLGLDPQLTQNIEWRFSVVPSKLFTLGSLLGVWPRMQKIFQGCDVVWFPNMDFAALRTLHIPYIITVHDASFVRYVHMLSVKERWRHWLLRPQTVIQNAAHIFTPSRSTAKDVSQLFRIAENNITTVYPPVHVAAPQNSIVPQFPAQIRQQSIVCIATLEPRKNIDALIAAFVRVRQKFPQLTLQLIGRPGYQSEYTMARVATLEDKGVVIHEYLSELQKEQILRNATVSVYPSVYEGFGFPPLEAQAHGVPVIAGWHSSLAEVLGDSAVLCDVLDVKSLAAAITEVLDDAELRTTLRIKGKQNIQRFTSAKAAQEISTVFEIVGTTAA